MHEYFDVLLDKYGGAYFTSEEKDYFFTDALNEYILDSIEQRSNIELTRTKTPEILTSLESTIRTIESIQPYLFDVSVNADPSTGRILMSSINSEIRNKYEESDIFTSSNFTAKYILSVGKRNDNYSSKLDSRKVKFVRHNDIYEFLDNDFKKPSSQDPVYLLNKDNLEVLPPDTSAVYNVTGIRSVENIRYDEDNYWTVEDTSVEPIIDDIYRPRVVRLAVSLAVASLGDVQKAQLIKNEEDF